MNVVQRVGIVLIGLLSFVVGVGAAIDLSKALTEADGRRRAAENGLRAIKKASAAPAEGVRAAYDEAAAANNAWLESVCASIHQGSPAPPDVTAAAERAATTLVTWVQERNTALNMPVPNEAAAATVRKGVQQNLTELASGAWSQNRGADVPRRTKAANELKLRLGWLPWEAVQ